MTFSVIQLMTNARKLHSRSRQCRGNDSLMELFDTCSLHQGGNHFVSQYKATSWIPGTAKIGDVTIKRRTRVHTVTSILIKLKQLYVRFSHNFENYILNSLFLKFIITRIFIEIKIQ